MGRTGSTDDFLKSVTRTSLKTSVHKSSSQQSESFKQYEKNLSRLTSQLRKGTAIGDPELSLKLERICIEFDADNFAKTQKEMDRIEKQITQSGAAEKSLEFLMTTPDDYRQHINALFPNGMKNLPEGDAYITHVQAQIKSLGQARSWMSTQTEKAFIFARQENLKAGLKAYRELQRKALFPPPDPQ